jgi:hypothetical protein
VSFSLKVSTQEIKACKHLLSIPSRVISITKEVSNRIRVKRGATTADRKTTTMAQQLNILADLTFRSRMIKISKLRADSLEQRELT